MPRATRLPAGIPRSRGGAGLHRRILSNGPTTRSGSTRRSVTGRRRSSNGCKPMLRKSRGRPRKRLVRHRGIYRSDVSSLLFTPGACPAFRSDRCQGIRHAGKNMPCPSSAMSSGWLFLDRVARLQSPSPLHQQDQNKSLPQRTRGFIIGRGPVS